MVSTLTASCGRFGYARIDTRGDAGDVDAMVDATMDAAITVAPPIHRYRFDGTGTVVLDTIGTADGTVMGAAALDGSGTLALAGGATEQYVNLPNGIVSSQQSVTIETWLVWDGDTGPWQRIFDFGNNVSGEDAQSNGTRHFSLAVNGTGRLRLVFDVDDNLDSTGWRVFWVSDALGAGVLRQVVATFDATPSPSVITLYVDGVLGGMTDVPDTEGLADIDDVNAWLGRAQWDTDAELDATLYDVRIYDYALDASEVMSRFTEGADAP
jgi:hypothetical protein